MTTATPFVIAIDGPAGSGKSSVSREVARRLGFGLLDTGAVYRALAWHVLDRGDSTEDRGAVLAALGEFPLSVSTDPDHPATRVGETDVSQAIRTDRVARAVSGVAAVTGVRDAVNERFRAIIAGVDAPGIVVEGRDITTVVAPDAPVRILLTADDAVRALRRAVQQGDEDAHAVARAIAARDARDGKVAAFTAPAPGVTLVDSTDLDFAQTVDAVVRLVHDAREGSAATVDDATGLASSTRATTPHAGSASATTTSATGAGIDQPAAAPLQEDHHD